MSGFSRYVAEAVIYNGKTETGEEPTKEEREEYLKKRYHDEIFGSGANIVEEAKAKAKKKKLVTNKEKYKDDDRFVGRYDRKTKVIVHPSREEVH